MGLRGAIIVGILSTYLGIDAIVNKKWCHWAYPVSSSMATVLLLGVFSFCSAYSLS